MEGLKNDRITPVERLLRCAEIGVATVVCAALSMLAGVAVHASSLPESDLAYGAPLFGLLDPFVLTIAIPVAGAAAVVAFPFACFLLVRTRLVKSLPVVTLSTLAGTAIGACLSIVIVPFSGCAAGIAAMIVCKRECPDARFARPPG